MMKRYQALVQVAIINYIILSWLIFKISIKFHDLYFSKLNYSIEFER